MELFISVATVHPSLEITFKWPLFVVVECVHRAVAILQWLNGLLKGIYT